MTVLAVAGSTFTFGLALEDQANPGLFKASPTIAAGDFQRSINGAGFANMDNLPTVTPAAGRLVQIVLSAAETTSAADGGVINIIGHDAAGAEWYDVGIEVRVAGADVATQTNITAGTITTVTNLTNAPTAGDLTATMKASVTAAVPTVAAIADGVLDEAMSGHATAGTLGATVSGTATLATSISSALTTLTNRVGAWTGTGVNTILGAFKAALSKTATLPTDIGGTFDPATDSTEAISEAVAGVGAGSTDWTAGEREQIRYRLQLDGTQTAPADTDLPAVDVTLWKGDTPSDLINGNVTSHLIDLGAGGGAADAVPGLFTFGQSYYYDDGAKLSAEGRQNVADGLLLAPTPGAAADGSAMDYLADTPANVWNYTTRTLTQSSTSTTDSTAAGSIARRRGDSWSISLTIGAITGYTSLWFTAKWDRDNTDAESVIQIKKNASGSGDGLLYVNGAAAANAALGSITVTDASTGAIVIAVDETVTDDLPPAGIYYDVQALVSGTISTLDSGTLTISADVTRAVA